jgi:probable rRNA maturation factor
MLLSKNIIIQDTIHTRKLLSKKKCTLWLSQIVKAETTLTIRIVDEAESQLLNNQYRKKNEPTNVLSFLISDNPLLGDIILCHSVIKKEALAQNKSIDDHYAHLIIHGYLHLIGFDHTKNDDALTMENKEIAVLKKLGIKNPYLSNIIE